MTKRRAPKKRPEWQPDNAVCEPSDMGEVIVTSNASADSYETTGPRETAVVTRGDMNRHALEHILPVAAAMCEEGQRREIAAERDARHTPSNTYWCVQIGRDTYETTSTLPHGMPALRWYGTFAAAHWEYCLALQKFRIARGEAARKIAREATFLLAGNGVQT